MANLRPVCLLALTAACGPGYEIGVKNAAPNAEIRSPDFETALLFQGITETFRGSVFDDDNPPEELLATWYVENEEVCPPSHPNSNGESYCDIALPAGDSNVRLVVSDPNNKTDEDIQVFWARPSAEPTADILTPAPSGQYYSDQVIDFEGSVSDVEDDATELVAWWESNLDGQLDSVDATPSSSGRVAGVGFLSEGEHQLRLAVQDRAGNITYDSTVVRVGPANRAPICEGITNPPDNGVIRVGTDARFIGQVSDPDVPSNQLTVTWESDKDGILGTSTPTGDGTVRFPYSSLSVNTHIISMKVSDAFGLDCESTALVIVDSPPTVNVTSPQTNRVYQVGESIDFAAVAIDGEDPEASLTVEWNDDLNGVISTVRPGDDGSLSFARSDMMPGQHLLSLTVTDSSGLSTQVQVPYSVNSLPGPAEVIISPSPARTEDALTGSVQTPSTDADGDPITYNRVWYRNNVAQLGLTAWTVPASNTIKGDIWRLEVTPADPYGSGPMATASLTIANTAPTVGSVSIVGGPFFESSTLTCTPADGADADSDSITYTYGWLVNNNPIPATSNTLDGSAFSRDDQVVCTATPNDGSASGTTASSAAVGILNTPPEVSAIQVNPAAPEANTQLTCSADYEDLDGDPNNNSIRWLVGGAEVGTGSTYTPTGLSAGTSVTCSITANDGTASGNTLTRAVVIAESAPSIVDVDITPNSAAASDPLTCAYSGYSDPQGDADLSRYQWTVNGGNAGTSATLTAGYSKGDTVRCTVTPSDGDFDGTPRMAEITIGNSRPTAPTITLEPAFPLAGLDDLVCSVRTRATDIDGDTITYRFAWTIDGEGFFAAADSAEESSILASDYNGLEEVVCTVTAFDGEDSGPAVSREIYTLPSIKPVATTGGSHSCALSRRGEVSCWGLPDQERLNRPNELYLGVDAGFNYTCGLVEDGSLTCWGVDVEDGPLAPPTGSFTGLDAGQSTACAIQSTGGIRCWGSDQYGVITNAPTTGEFISVGVGDRHACAVRGSGSLLCWGNNSFRQREAPSSGTWEQVSSGSIHSCARDDAGSVACWGYNNAASILTVPATVTNAVDIAAGVQHSCAVLDDGTVRCWGPDAGRTTPVNNDGNGDPIFYVDVDASIHSCGVATDGTAYCWGPGDNGQTTPPR